MKNKLYVKFSKCDFWIKNVLFIGYIISKNGQQTHQRWQQLWIGINSKMSSKSEAFWDLQCKTWVVCLLVLCCLICELSQIAYDRCLLTNHQYVISMCVVLARSTLLALVLDTFSWALGGSDFFFFFHVWGCRQTLGRVPTCLVAFPILCFIRFVCFWWKSHK